jgi:glycosyltransferase involved in cell wall biosynthesis
MKEKIAVLIPCYNEEKTVQKVIKDFRKELPEAHIYVYDNNSSDQTVENAKACKVNIGYEYKKGKGNVVRTMFREVDADVYIMVDGDATYPAAQVHKLIEPVINGKADMTVGTRLESHEDHSFRMFHKFGNTIVCQFINLLFKSHLIDVLSGYRCFSSRFVKNVSILSKGFEVETELTLQALDRNFIIREIPIEYQKRPKGSYSKLNTYGDGLLVFKTIFWLFKDYKPLKFFSIFGTIAIIIGVILGSIPISDYISTGKVTHPSTAVLATGFILIALLAFSTGLILDSINRRYKEQYQLITDYIIFTLKQNSDK